MSEPISYAEWSNAQMAAYEAEQHAERVLALTRRCDYVASVLKAIAAGAGMKDRPYTAHRLRELARTLEATP